MAVEHTGRMKFWNASRIWRSGTDSRRPVAVLLLLSLVWTLVLAPALATVRVGTPFPAPSRASLVAQIVGGASERETAETDPKHCACLICGGVTTCCCPPTDAAVETASVPSCAFRAACDRATADLSLPFLGWNAVLPVPVAFATPAPQGVACLTPPTGNSLPPADLPVPETPPRLS
jgi:hypothetical protein